MALWLMWIAFDVNEKKRSMCRKRTEMFLSERRFTAGYTVFRLTFVMFFFKSVVKELLIDRNKQ